MEPCAFTLRSDPDGMFVIASDVVVAPVVMSEVIEPFVAKRLPAVSAVEEAYGNCDAATVELEKNTPWVNIEVVVAAVDVPNVFMLVKRYAKFPDEHDCVVTAPVASIVRHCPAWLLRLEITRLVVDALADVIAVVDAYGKILATLEVEVILPAMN